MKRLLCVLALIVSVAAIVTGCGSKEAKINSNNSNKIKIMSTIFPIYDLCREIAGDSDNIELSWLLDNGVDLHNFNPSADDIINIGKQDLFLYVGGESDKWVNELNNIKGKKISLMNTIKGFLKEEELKEGMEAEDHDHTDHADHGNHDERDEEEIEYDEHIWLSLKNMKEIARAVMAEMIKLDPDNMTVYTNNAVAYINKLDELDKEYEKTFDLDSQYVMLFADRFPFRYMTSDYNIEYFAAFLGCSAETEASFKTIKFLTDKLDEHKLKTIWVLEGSDRKIADTIISNAKTKNVEIKELDSLQSINREKDKEGATYLNIMTKNLNVLKEAVNK